MGILVDYKVESKTKKFWILLSVDIFIILFLVFVALGCKGEWMSGYNYCKDRCIVYSELENISSSDLIPPDFNLSGETGITVKTTQIEPP